MVKAQKIAIYFLVLVVVFFIFRSIPLGKKINELKDKVTEQEGVISSLSESEAAARGLIEEREKTIAAKDERIRKLTESVETKTQEMGERGKRILELESELVHLTDKDAIIANLHAQIEVWKERFSLAEGTIRDKDEIIFSLTEKYNAQVDITKTIETTLSRRIGEQQKLIEIQKDLISSVEGRYKLAKLKGGIGTAVVILAAGILIYSAVR